MPPRETLPNEKLGAAVDAASFPLLRTSLGRGGWALEPKPVMDLLAKIKHAGVPLVEYAGVKPYRGVPTGFNEAFLIDTATRDRLVAADPLSADIIKPYLRGQDVQRWSANWAGLWMIFARRGIDIQRYPRFSPIFKRSEKTWNQSPPLGSQAAPMMNGPAGSQEPTRGTKLRTQ